MAPKGLDILNYHQRKTKECGCLTWHSLWKVTQGAV